MGWGADVCGGGEGFCRGGAAGTAIVPPASPNRSNGSPAGAAAADWDCCWWLLGGEAQPLMKSSLASNGDAWDDWLTLAVEACGFPLADPAVGLGTFAGEVSERLNAPRKSSSKLLLAGSWGAADGPRREAGGGEPAKKGSPLAVGCWRELEVGNAAEKGSPVEAA